jgi:hypothetical protein
MLVTTATVTLVTPSALASGSPLCAAMGSGLCLSDHGNPNDFALIFTENRNPGPNQDITITPNTSACGGTGKVRANPPCPFLSGSGLNTAFNGKLIETINLADVGKCIGSNGANPIVIACNASGTNFVVDPNASGAGRQLVNVVMTNDANNSAAVFLDSDGTVGDQAIFTQPVFHQPSNWAH